MVRCAAFLKAFAESSDVIHSAEAGKIGRKKRVRVKSFKVTGDRKPGADFIQFWGCFAFNSLMKRFLVD